MHKCTNIFKLLYKELADNVSCVPKHVAMCDMALKYFVGRHLSLYLWDSLQYWTNCISSNIFFTRAIPLCYNT